MQHLGAAEIGDGEEAVRMGHGRRGVISFSMQTLMAGDKAWQAVQEGLIPTLEDCTMQGVSAPVVLNNLLLQHP